MKILFKINIFTYLLLILSMLSGYFREIIIIYLILFIHEIGHVLTMSLFNINIKQIIFYPYGGVINSDILINTNSIKILVISLGGIFIQLLLFLITYIFFRINLIDYYYFKIFNKYNLYIILFNLLPIYPLDGFKLVNSLLELFFSFIKSIKISLMLNIVFIITFFIYLYVYKINNYIIITFLIVNLFNYVKNIKYIVNKFYLERIIYDLKYNGLVSVKCKKRMYKNRFNYINGISEDIYLKNYNN